MPDPLPSYGDVWLVDLDPIVGHEQAGRRPCVIVSTNLFNHGPAGLVVIMPMTRRNRNVPLHVVLGLPDTTPGETSVVVCDAVRSVSKARLILYRKSLSPAAMREIADRLIILFNL